MIRYVFALVCLLFSFSAAAENEGSEINVVIFAPKNPEAAVAARLPSCNDTGMLTAVAEKIREYQTENPGMSIVSRRKQALIIKNLKEFSTIPVAAFDNASNYEVAKELIMTKINYHITEENMRLCKGNNGSEIYLLMYPEGSGFRVQILNFVPSSDNGNEFSIYYEMPDLAGVSDGQTAENLPAEEEPTLPKVPTSEPKENAAAEDAPTAVEVPVAAEFPTAAEK